MYTRDQVLKASIEYFNGDDLAADVFVTKYALRNNKEFFELTPDDMHKRLAKEFAKMEQKYDNPISEDYLYTAMKNFKYIIPQGSPMAGIGNPFKLSTLSNCYVISSPNDSYPGILIAEREMIELMKRRGGVGFSIHTLRPKEIPTKSVAEKSSGLVLFGERYSRGTREVAQDGRRGALMISCKVDHPDILHFINAKLDMKIMTGANISVMITDEFMDAVDNDQEYDVKFENESVGTFERRLNAKEVWDVIIQNAWKSAEPGVLFWDNIIKESPAGLYGGEWKETSTNPCAELPLCPYDSCRLLALNLFSFVDDPFTPSALFNWGKFEEYINVAQRMMDDLVDLEIEKIEAIINMLECDIDPTDKGVEIRLWKKIYEKAVNGRRTGLGITAEGDMLAALGLQYGTEKATNFAEEIHKKLAVLSYMVSIDMAKERGSFPICKPEIEKNDFLNRIFKELPKNYKLDWGLYGRRNIANLTIAPTGSVSTMTQTTGGIEPCFLVYYTRRRKINSEDNGVRVDFIDEVGDHWQEYKMFHHNFVKWFDLNWYKLKISWFDKDYKPELQNLSEKQLEEIIKKSPYYLSTSKDIDWKKSVEMQGRIQKWVDHSISKTINIPADTSVEVVDELYRIAHKVGCKGVTIYRDGSRSGVMVKQKDVPFDYQEQLKRKELGEDLECDIFYKTALKKDWMILVGLYKGKPYEIFALERLDYAMFPHKIKKGVVERVKSGHYSLIGVHNNKEYRIGNILAHMTLDDKIDTRKYSLMLRHKIDPIHIINEIEKYSSISSFDKVVQRVLKSYINTNGGKCPECGAKLLHAEGCEKCTNCTYTVCG
jgi:ribonucleoside-diphosphate reductase alpha chain